MDIISILISLVVGAVGGMVFAARQSRGEGSTWQALKAILGGGPRPTVPK